MDFSRSGAITINGTGASVPRVEDARFLMGLGRYVDDIKLTDMAYAFVVRSPHAHARVLGIDAALARRAPGVLAVLTSEDAVRCGLGEIQGMFSPDLRDDSGVFCPGQPVLATERVRHVGDRVALVVAETLAQAKDSAELIEIDYEPLPHVTSSDLALAHNAPQIWEGAKGNLCLHRQRGDRAAVDAAFARAAHVTSLSIYYPRASANPMEPRAAVGRYDRHDRRYTLYTGSPQPFRTREFIATTVLNIPETHIRVVTPDVGGAFGMRGTIYAEEILVLWAARLLNRPVKWTGERSECLMSDMHGRDQRSRAEIALDAEGRILAVRASVIANVGAYLVYSAGIPPTNAIIALSGAYDVPLVYATVDAVFTNTNPLGPFRGSGRPEATFVIERLVDKAAREMGLDPAEIRRRNLIPPSAMPYTTPGGRVMDCGNLELVLDKALTLADWNGFAKRRQHSEEQGLRRGIGLCLHAETAGLHSERMEITVDTTGAVTVVAGTVSSGQGHETMYAQLASDWLGVAIDHVRVRQGDTDKVVFGRGTFAARSAMTAGSALRRAAHEVIKKGKSVAAHMLEANVSDIEFVDGVFAVVGTDRRLSLHAVAKESYKSDRIAAEFGIGLTGIGTFSGPASFPYGCMVCEVEVDPATGALQVDRLSFVDDVGVMISPVMVEGQAHGSTVQGAGQVLMEEVQFDPESGQLLSGSFLDYCMPRADEFPSMASDFVVVPTKSNLLGVKGGSESGNFGAPSAVINALLDALSPLGVTEITLPATPHRVWRAIQEAQGGRPTSLPPAPPRCLPQ